MKSSGTIGNRTRDLPPSSAVPRPTTPPRVPRFFRNISHVDVKLSILLPLTADSVVNIKIQAILSCFLNEQLMLFTWE